jgi:hypothetical protein
MLFPSLEDTQRAEVQVLVRSGGVGSTPMRRRITTDRRVRYAAAVCRRATEFKWFAGLEHESRLIGKISRR